MSLSIAHILPLASEKHWSDLLAVLIENDPISAAKSLPIGGQCSHLTVKREVKVNKHDRVDLVLEVDGSVHTVIEVKVLSGLGRTQLARYHNAFPDAAAHILIFPQRLTIGSAQAIGWHAVRWEQLLSEFAHSPNTWVAETAGAWLRHLESMLPRVSADTRWNDLRHGEDFVIAIRARMSWVFDRLDPPEPIVHDLVESSAGVSWVVRLYAPATKPGYRVLIEAEEGLGVRDYPKTVSTTSREPRGPSVKVMVQQTGVHTSARFDWNYLHRMWPFMDAARDDWVRNRPRFKAAHDSNGWQSIVSRGAPEYLGIGFGEGQTKRTSECMFGARFQLPPSIALEDVVRALNESAKLILKMASV